MDQTFILIAIIFAAIPAFTFPVLYAYKSRWWKNYVGWMQMNMSVTIAVVMMFVLYLVAFPNPKFVNDIRIFEFVIIGCALWWQLYVLHKARKEQASCPKRRSTDGR